MMRTPHPQWYMSNSLTQSMKLAKDLGCSLPVLMVDGVESFLFPCQENGRQVPMHKTLAAKFHRLSILRLSCQSQLSLLRN